MLCIGSPVTAWLTSRIERRPRLTATLALLALANAASALAPDYTSLLVIRLVMLAVGALYTPQAAGTGIAPCSVELCEASVAVNDVKRPSQFGQERDCWSPFRSERQARPARQEVACRL